MNKKLILVASPPACGKTYVSEMIAKMVGNIVYLDKDDLGDLIRACFAASDMEADMDGDFYKNNLRCAEYSTILNIAFSALRFENHVILNAPFLKEVRDVQYMQSLKKRANENGAQLCLVWVSASEEICYERMKKRNSERDTKKLQNFDEYVRKINFTPPLELEKTGAVDKLFVFDANDDKTFEKSLKQALEIII